MQHLNLLYSSEDKCPSYNPPFYGSYDTVRRLLKQEVEEEEEAKMGACTCSNEVVNKENVNTTRPRASARRGEKNMAQTSNIFPVVTPPLEDLKVWSH